MNKEDIIQRLGELNFSKKEYWVIAGSAMVLHGFREETHDIDLGCTTILADQLEQCYPCQILPDKTRKITIANDIEIFENWLYDKIMFIEGIPVISSYGLLEMKKSMGREKDLADIRLIQSDIETAGS